MLKVIMWRSTLIAFASFISLSAYAHADPKAINVPAGDLLTGLETLAKECGAELVYQPDQLKGLHTRGVSGTLEPRDAVTKLLEGTALSVRVDSTGAMLITDPRNAGRSTGRDTRQSLEDGKSKPTTYLPATGRPILLAQGPLTGRPEPESVRAAEDGSRRALEEVVVSATKRDEKLSDVPISMSVLTAADIERRGVTDMDGYLRGIPGVNFMSTRSWDNSIVIRGVQTTPNDQNYSASPTVSTYFGETATTTAGGINGGSGVDMKLVDVQRVEVLRGPQGTAFGDSSLGGTVRTIPNAPNLSDQGGFIAAEYSNTARYGADNTMFQGALNLPLIKDKLAVRLVGYQFEDSGYWKVVDASDPAVQAYIAKIGGTVANQASRAGDQTIRGARGSLLWQIDDNSSLSLLWTHQRASKNPFDGFYGDTAGEYLKYPGFDFPQNTVLKGTGGGASVQWMNILNATFKRDFERATLTSTLSYLTSESNAAVYTPVYAATGAFNVDNPSNHKGTSGEVRLASHFDGPLQGLAGLYAEHLNDGSDYGYYWAGNAASNTYSTNAYVGEYDDFRKLSQKAAFGELSYQLLEKLKLTAGGRFYHYDRTMKVVRSGPVFGFPNTTDVSVTNARKSGETFKANIDYKASKDMLLYGGWSQGFRLGRTAAGLPSGLCDQNGDGLIDGSNNVSIASTQIINSDKLTNFELGAKSTWLGGRLNVNAEAFHIDWTGLPIRQVARCGTVNLSYVANAGAAKSDGVAIEGALLLASKLRVNYGASYTDARLSKDAPGLGASKGARLPGSPKENGNLGLESDFPVAGFLGSVRADIIYTGGFYGDILSSPGLRAGDYVTVDLRAGLKMNHVKLDAFVHNLTNRDDYVWRILARSPTLGFRLEPRRVGIQLGYEF